jgi:hypothetical protein
LNEGQRHLNHSQQHRPTFTKAFPTDARLDALVDAFARGDYAHVREAGTKLAADSGDEVVRRAALTLVARTSPDALTKALLLLAAVLLLVLSAWWITHGKPPAASRHTDPVH